MLFRSPQNPKTPFALIVNFWNLNMNTKNPIDSLRLLQENKSCFDCHEKGTMYCVMAPFGVFVCSACAGIHREFSHKVKGISMSNFTETETKFLAENGNKVFTRHLVLQIILECPSYSHVELEP